MADSGGTYALHTGCGVWKKAGQRLEVRERSQMGREVGLCGGIGGHGRVFLLGQWAVLHFPQVCA